MNNSNPMNPTPVLCKATNRQGVRCKRAPIPGGTVCHFHGGAAPQVKRAAALRLSALVEPAIATLSREMVRGGSSADRQRAANSILDRAGIVRGQGVDAELARALILERLIALREDRGEEVEYEVLEEEA